MREAIKNFVCVKVHVHLWGAESWKVTCLDATA